MTFMVFDMATMLGALVYKMKLKTPVNIKNALQKKPLVDAPPRSLFRLPDGAKRKPEMMNGYVIMSEATTCSMAFVGIMVSYPCLSANESLYMVKQLLFPVEDSINFLTAVAFVSIAADMTAKYFIKHESQSSFWKEFATPMRGHAFYIFMSCIAPVWAFRNYIQFGWFFLQEQLGPFEDYVYDPTIGNW